MTYVCHIVRVTTCIENLETLQNMRRKPFIANFRLGLHQCFVNCCESCLACFKNFAKSLNHCEHFCTDTCGVLVALTDNNIYA